MGIIAHKHHTVHNKTLFHLSRADRHAVLGQVTRREGRHGGAGRVQQQADTQRQPWQHGKWCDKLLISKAVCSATLNNAANAPLPNGLSKQRRRGGNVRLECDGRMEKTLRGSLAFSSIGNSIFEPRNKSVLDVSNSSLFQWLILIFPKATQSRCL